MGFGAIILSTKEYAAMSIQLEIPDSVAEALRLAPADQKQQLLIELAMALYARSILPLGKARELTGMSKYEFGLRLGERAITLPKTCRMT
jgi:predicted HTH domain antitoxin